jgi:glycosyltransferase involved in cell wall biosynthesis
LRIALVHDYLTQYGGAERVLDVLYATYADSPRQVYTSFYVPQQLPPPMRQWPVTTSALARVPFAARTHRAWLPLYPRIFRRLGKCIDANVVIADTSAWAHHAAPPSGTPFIVYCHSPARFLHGDEHYLEAADMPAPLGWLSTHLFAWLRHQDVAAAQVPDRIIANSAAVQRRIRDVWHRDAEIIHPPIDTQQFRPTMEKPVQPWFLVVSRLVPHKWIDRAIRASNRSGLPLRIIGTGRAERSLKRIAGPQVEFMGALADQYVVDAMQQCQALLLPGVEDFGMTAVEVQAAGRPAIAAAGGGALETVVDGETGVLVPVGDIDALAEAMRRVSSRPWDTEAIQRHADRFDLRHFQARIRGVVDQVIEERG